MCVAQGGLVKLGWVPLLEAVLWVSSIVPEEVDCLVFEGRIPDCQSACELRGVARAAKGAGRTGNLRRQLGSIKGALAHVRRWSDVDLARVGVGDRSSRRGRHLTDCGRWAAGTRRGVTGLRKAGGTEETKRLKQKRWQDARGEERKKGTKASETA